jgi:hypothetical protein
MKVCARARAARATTCVPRVASTRVLLCAVRSRVLPPELLRSAGPRSGAVCSPSSVRVSHLLFVGCCCCILWWFLWRLSVCQGLGQESRQLSVSSARLSATLSLFFFSASHSAISNARAPVI